MILLLDNYDSFTWNLHHYVVQLTDEEVVVKRNDAICVEDAETFKSIIYSPGPGLPEAAGVMPGIIKKYGHDIPMLGICLGHQALGECFGAKLKQLPQVLHGVQREITISDGDDRLFTGMPAKLLSGHYHSWVLSNNPWPEELRITATGPEGSVMALSHRHYPLSGVQFHPESVMTPEGIRIIDNWLRFCS